MKLLKNQEEFEAWKKDYTYQGDTADQPREFPCYVYKIVQSWQLEEHEAIYLYLEDAEDMLNKLMGSARTSGL